MAEDAALWLLHQCPGVLDTLRTLIEEGKGGDEGKPVWLPEVAKRRAE